MAAYLSAAHASLGPAALLYYGLMETYSWDEERRHATQFDFSFGKNRPCRRVGGLVGPFSFAKGAAYWLATPLVRQIVADERVRSELLETATAAESGSAAKSAGSGGVSSSVVDSAEHSAAGSSAAGSSAGSGAGGDRRKRKAPPSVIPYEDVYTGLALAKVARGAALTAVQMGKQVFSDLWGFYIAPSTLLWHQRFKDPSRIVLVHRWAKQHHCPLPPPVFDCYSEPYSSCSGAAWRRCSVRHNFSACSARRVDLKDYFNLRGARARQRVRRGGSRAECDALQEPARRRCLSGERKV